MLHNRLTKITTALLLLITLFSFGQDVYKTPSGKKYHLNSCRMVENVSAKLLSTDDISDYGLSPCKICKPPVINSISKNITGTNKAKGTSSSVRCLGKTQRGTRCKHMTQIANGYCYQHTKQNSTSNTSNYNTTPNSTTTSLCGARTKSGSSCRRKVKGGGRCYQH